MSAFVVLAETMRSAGYAESTIEQNRRMFVCLNRFTTGGSYKEEAGRAFIEAGKANGEHCCSQHRRVKERIVRLIEGYLADGCFDLSPRKAHGPRPKPEAQQLSSALSEYEAALSESGIADSTAAAYADMARLFLLFAEEEGEEDVRSVEPSHVLGFMSRMSEVRSGTDPFHTSCFLRAYLRYLGRFDLVEALALAASPRKHPIIEVLSDEDEEAIARACCNRLVSARDAAITLLALTTGLRAGDIVNMRMGDICWRSMTVSIIQRKTANPVKLPLQAAVADAIAEYVLGKRPNTGDDHVFLQAKAPYAPLAGASSVYNATRRASSAVGVDAAGTRLFRRNAATKMLRAGTASPIISALLGHADPKSTDIYMELDSESMRACVLPLPQGVRSWL